MSSTLPERRTGSVDLVRDSLDHAVAVSFPKSRSAAYAAALNIAQQADKYSDTEVNGTLFHLAAFGRNQEQVARALSLCRYLSGLKSVQYYAGGKLIIERHRIDDVLSCLMEANACNDHRAHCNQVISDPFRLTDKIGVSFELDDMKPVTSYLLPCMYLTKFGAVTLHKNHPATPEDQIQALAVKRGCEWCPNFKYGDFKKT